MSLRFKRNLPLVLALTGILAILVLLIGNQPIVSYSVNSDALRAMSISGISNNVNQLYGLFSIVQP